MPLTTRRALFALALTSAAAGPAALLKSALADAPPATQPGATRTLRTDTLIKAEGGREVRVSSWPAWGKTRGVILFSHGALAAPENYERVIGPWNAAGFDVRGPLHVDSTEHPDHAKYGMLESWRARIEDMRALANSTNALAYVAAGHSYGGLVALTLGGVAAEVPPGLQAPLRDSRAKAVVAFSPSDVTPGLATREGYGTLAVPASSKPAIRTYPTMLRTDAGRGISLPMMPPRREINIRWCYRAWIIISAA